MPQAVIEINGVPGSNDNLPINTLVQLTNLNIGGEVSYLWEILDQPLGAADLLSNALIQNPTFTPKKEGTYLLRLTVNKNLPSEQFDEQIVGIRQLKTGERVPASGETIQDSLSEGWATPVNSYLKRIDSLLSDPGILVGVAGAGGLTAGNILQASGTATIKTGLPGQETVPSFTLAPASALGNVEGLLVVLISDVAGNTSPASGAIVRVRYIGRYAGAPFSSTPGTLVYVDNTGNFSTTQGTIRRQIGTVMASSGGTSDIWVDGVGGADITPITAPYVLFGAPASGMTGAVRIDGSNATALTGPARFLSGGVGVVPLQVEAFSGQTADLFQVLASGGGALATIDSNGDLVFKTAASGGTNQGIYFPDWTIVENSSSSLVFWNGAVGASARIYMPSGSAAVLNGTDGTATWLLETVTSPGHGAAVGTLSNHPFYFQTNATNQWEIDASGNFLGVSATPVKFSNSSTFPTASYALFKVPNAASGAAGLNAVNGFAGNGGNNGAGAGGAGGYGFFGTGGFGGNGTGAAGGAGGYGLVGQGGDGGGGTPNGAAGIGLAGIAGTASGGTPGYGGIGYGAESGGAGFRAMGQYVVGSISGIAALWATGDSTQGWGTGGSPSPWGGANVPNNPAGYIDGGFGIVFGDTTAIIYSMPVKNTLTKQNFVKAWCHISTNSSNTPNIDDGFNIASVSASSTTLTINWGNGFSGIGGNYAITATAAGGSFVAEILSSSQTSVTFQILQLTYGSSPAIALVAPNATSSLALNVIACGTQ